MSFQDEIRQSLKPPQEIAEETKKLRKEKIMKDAESAMEHIRFEMKCKAEHGEYELINGKRIIRCRKNIFGCK